LIFKEHFVKNKQTNGAKRRSLLGIIAILTLSFIVLSCDKDKDDDEETASVPQPAQKTLSFGSVTISSPDEHLPSAWNALCDDVVTALETAYAEGNNPHKWRCETVFGNTVDIFGNGGNGVEIVLVNNLANNWEVRDGEWRTMYLKTGSIATADYRNAVACMGSSVPEVG
jgi:hypothetical protein